MEELNARELNSLRNSTRGVKFEERGRAAKLLERSLMLIKVVYMAASDSR